MPIFGWPASAGTWGLLFEVVSSYSEPTRDEAEVARLLAQRVLRDEQEELKMARTRWLEDHHAERSFPCGIVPDPRELETGERPLNVPISEPSVIQVTAAILPDDLVFLTAGRDDVDEVGRIPRPSITGVDVTDRSGTHVPEPLHESFEPPALSLTVLNWSNEGQPDQERFAFHSVWLAWQAAHKLLAAKPL